MDRQHPSAAWLGGLVGSSKIEGAIERRRTRRVGGVPSQQLPSLELVQHFESTISGDKALGGPVVKVRC